MSTTQGNLPGQHFVSIARENMACMVLFTYHASQHCRFWNSYEILAQKALPLSICRFVVHGMSHSPPFVEYEASLPPIQGTAV